MIKHEDLQYINWKTAHIKVAVNDLRSMSYCLINRAAAVWSYTAVEGGGSSPSHPPLPPPSTPPPPCHTNLYPPSTSSHSETRTHSLSELHTTLRHSICMPAPSSLDALRLVIKGIDPLNLYELQFVPAARPVRGLREAGTSARGVCACCFAVVKERGKGFYSSSSELLTSGEEALWQEEQGRGGTAAPLMAPC